MFVTKIIPYAGRSMASPSSSGATTTCTFLIMFTWWYRSSKAERTKSCAWKDRETLRDGNGKNGGAIMVPPRGKAPGVRAQRCRVWRPNCQGNWALLVLLLCLPCLALAQETRSLDTIMTGVATELAQRFPPVTGEVIKMEPDEVTSALGDVGFLMPVCNSYCFVQGRLLSA